MSASADIADIGEALRYDAEHNVFLYCPNRGHPWRVCPWNERFAEYLLDGRLTLDEAKACPDLQGSLVEMNARVTARPDGRIRGSLIAETDDEAPAPADPDATDLHANLGGPSSGNAEHVTREIQEPAPTV